MSDLLLDRYKRALEGLTPGGSEFVNDPERCAAYVRDVLDSKHRLIIRFKREGDELRKQLSKLNEILTRIGELK